MASKLEKPSGLTKRLALRLFRRARRAGHRLLGIPAVVSRARGRPAAIALTFDDGPSEWTLEIARALEAHGCRGTFFLLGSAVEQRPGIVATLAASGHELGNHLWTHGDPARQTRPAIRAEIERAADAISAAGGPRPRLVRPPYCGAPYAVARAAARTAKDALIVLRSVDPADWRAESPAEIVEAVLANVKPGDIVCLHDGIAPNNSGSSSRSATAAAVAELVPALLERGLRPVTVSELLA
jgi:peptidoglycan/xylan/chitin deacetylase (PgdA/CDA1 family)